MKILRLDLTAFGSFTDATLDLGAGQEGLHVIYGANEAGKSTALRALRQLFYGIPETSTDNFLHAHTKLRIGALLRHSDGTILECVRRKGRKNTLLAADGSTLDDAVLRKFLGGVDQALFESLFGIDHEGLVQGGAALVQGAGEVGRILFAAGAGIGDLRAVQQRLEQEMETLFKTGGKNPQINQALSELEKTRKQVRELELPSAEWQQHDQELRTSSERKRSVEQQLEEKERARARLQRVREALPLMAEHQTRLSERTPLADAVLLPEDFSERRRDATSALGQARTAEKEAVAELAQLDGAIAELSADMPEALLEQAASIAEVYKRLGSHQKASADRARLAIGLTQLETEARRSLRDLRPDLDLERAEELRLSVGDRVRIQDLGGQQHTLIKACESAEERVADLHRKLEDAKRRLHGIEPARDTDDLRQALRRLQQTGPIDDALRTARQDLRRAEEQAAVELKALPLWSGTLAELEKLPVPHVEMSERFDDEFAALDQDRKGLRQRLDDLYAERLETDRQLEQLRLEQDVPTETELDSARRGRDELWAQIRAGGVSALSEQAEDYERSVRRADDLGDRLRREAGRVAQHAQLQAERRRSADREELLKRQLNDVEATQQRQRADWQAAWQPLGISPRSPREMRAWSRQWAALVDQARTIRSLRQQAESLEQRVHAHRQELSDHLRTLNEPVRDDEPLAGLSSRGQKLVEHIEGVLQERRQLEQSCEALSQELPQAQGQSARARDQLTRWRDDWREAMKLLGQPAQATVAEANALVAGVGDLLAKLGEAAGHRERIAGIDRDGETFRRDVQALAQRVAPELAALPVEQVVEQLNARLTRAHAAREQLGVLTEQRTREQRKLRQARQTIVDMEAQLALLCRDAGCADAAGLPQAEERSQRSRKLNDDIRRLEQQLWQWSGGDPLDDFLADLKEVDADTIEPELRRLGQEIADLKQENEQLGESIGGARALLERMDGGAKAAEAAELAQGLLAQIGGAAEQYAHLRLAARVLQGGIERYRDRNQAPIVTRAAELFARLTRGSFAGLRVDLNDVGETILLGIRPGKEVVAVGGMSAGTRDQLYLALRLASLEAFMTRNEPLPLILDDLLVHFDNERLAAVLQVLAEFAQRTQIIFFTHHAHLVELAEHHLDGGVLFTHRLESRSQESGVGSQESGVRSQNPGVRIQEPEASVATSAGKRRRRKMAQKQDDG